MSSPKLVVPALVTTLLVGFAPPLFAADLADVQMPDRIEVAGKPLLLNGMGIRKVTMLEVEVYVAGLYLEQRSRDALEIIGSAQTKRIALRFKRRVGRRELVQIWEEGFKKNAGRELAALRNRIYMLSSWMPDLHAGDTLTFTYIAGRGVEVGINGNAKGTIVGASFARTLWSIWLGAEPLNEELKRGLLGLRTPHRRNDHLRLGPPPGPEVARGE